MKKINILKESKDFERVIKLKNFHRTNCYNIYFEKNTENVYKFGLSVGKKLGNAVIRNKIKRQLKSIIDKKNYQNNFNCIIIVKKAFLEQNYDKNSNELYDAFKKISIIKGEIDENKNK